METERIRSSSHRAAALCLCLFAAGWASGEAPRPSVGSGSTAATSGDEAGAWFENEVYPILQRNCFKCHGPNGKPKGGLRLTSREALLRGGDTGPAIDLDSPAQSLLLGAINYDLLEMPPSGKLPQGEIDLLTRWIEVGAPWPQSVAHPATPVEDHAPVPYVTEATRAHWAFRPVVPPRIPDVEDQSWVRNPIDAFILASLERSGLRPSPPADKQTLLRRVHYDLLGVPPGPEEVRAFLADDSPRAWDKVVDRLLESPQYGERWGRHWLDLVRFAETNSYERDGPKPFAWRYRDYVIEAFNSDKPYDRFVMEQLAGDELDDRTPDSLIATGYYRLGLWDDEPADPEQALYDDLDDILSTTGQVFLGLTVGCARCHDHKLDPLPQRDYYRLLSFFHGIQRFGVRSPESVAAASLRPLASPEEQARHDHQVAEFESRMHALDKAIAAIEERVKPDFVPVEHEEFRHDQNREALVRKRVPALVSQEEFEGYVERRRERRELDNHRPRALEQALCVTEIGPVPRETHVLVRGNPHVQGEAVSPGYPSVLTEQDPVMPLPPEGSSTSLRRRELARWIASADNPLTARVMANRVWQYHFGRGIVRTASNFGLQGERPTHPELLDWLACEFVASGWRLKQLHRLIVTSNTYQMASRGNGEGLARDPQNDLFWRFDMRRLSAEEIRDSILAVNGSLNPKMGGPGVYVKIPQEVLAGQSRPGEGWGLSPPSERARRSIYIHAKRSLVTPILAVFDMPESDTTCPARFVSTQPTQALALLNSEFLNEESGVFADFVRQEAGGDLRRQVQCALERALQREPQSHEVDRGVALVERLTSQFAASPAEALRQFCLTLYNLNEFLYLD